MQPFIMSADIKKSLKPISFPVSNTEKYKQPPPQQWSKDSWVTETIPFKASAGRGQAGNLN